MGFFYFEICLNFLLTKSAAGWYNKISRQTGGWRGDKKGFGKNTKSLKIT